MADPYRHRRTIRFADCDPAGIVYFPRYFDMFHAAIEDWYREALEIDYWGKLRDARIGFPAVHAACDYLRPCAMGDVLELAVLIERIGTRSLTLRIDGWCAGEKRLEGRIVSVMTSLDSHASIDIPADLRAAYQRYEEIVPHVGVMGAGAWGTALAVAACRAGCVVTLWGRDPEAVAAIATSRENARYLPGLRLPEDLAVTSDPGSLVACDPVLLAVPAQTLRGVAALAPGSARLVICAKGLEQASGLRLSQVLAELRPSAVAGVLSGPSFAGELARGLPTAVTLAAPGLAAAQALASLLAGPGFRLYPTDDMTGVEIGGALKNVIAIASGVVMGRDLGENARAAVVTRGLAELARLGRALGARPETLMGLSGLGDLVLTATSLTSRNTRFGYGLGRGAAPAELMAAGHALSEGAWTAGAACRLAASVGVELPLAEAVRDVIEGTWTVERAIDALLSRPPAASE